MMPKKLLFSLLGIASLAQAADARIQVETYDKSRVYNIYADVGRAVLIQLEADETLESPNTVLAMGDSEAWNLVVRGNNIVFKPSQAKPQTNMVVVTNKRTYSFDLEMTPKGGVPTYVLQFLYPDNEIKKPEQKAIPLKIRSIESVKKITVNTDYFWIGKNGLLKPTAAWDDGRFTYLKYDHAGELPVFFKVLPDGTEALINTSVNQDEKNTIILQEVIRKARVRLGNDVIEIINHNYQLPEFNATGAGIPDAVRVERVK